MSITPLSAARIVGEVGLAGGTATGGAFAAKYSSQVSVITGERDQAREEKRQAEKQNKEQTDTRNNSAEVFQSKVRNHYNTLEVYWAQLKVQGQLDNPEYKNEIDKSLKELEKLLQEYNPQS